MALCAHLRGAARSTPAGPPRPPAEGAPAAEGSREGIHGEDERPRAFTPGDETDSRPRGS